MSYEHDQGTEREYLQMQDDLTYEDGYLGLRATTYRAPADTLSYTRGKNMVGKPCPTCGSTLVIRTNSRDKRRFIACDKTRRPRCPFSISYNETLLERTRRIEAKCLS